MQCGHSRWLRRVPGLRAMSRTDSSSCQALVTKFRRQFSQGFSVLSNCTWSTILSNGMVGSAARSVSRMNHCPQCHLGLAPCNVPQRLAMSFLYQLPLGRGQLFLHNVNPILEHGIDGWSVDSVTMFTGGNPFTVNASSNTGLSFVDSRADRLCNGRTGVKNKHLRANGGYFFGTSCFTAPASRCSGHSGFDIVSGRGLNNWDNGIHKDIPIRASLRIQFRTEFLDAFNHARFDDPDSYVTDTNYGRIPSTRGNAKKIQCSDHYFGDSLFSKVIGRRGACRSSFADFRLCPVHLGGRR